MTDQLHELGEAPGPDGASASDTPSPVDGTDPFDAEAADDADPAEAEDERANPSGGSARRERISRWDRPPAPRDWRFYVGTLGRVLIATGLLLFGFVAYQLWGTGIETARAQDRLEGEFEELLVEFGRSDDAFDGSAGEGVGDTSRDGTDDRSDARIDPPAGEPDGDPDVEGAAAVDDGDADDDDLEMTVGEVTNGVPVAVDLSDEAVVHDPLPQPFRGDPLFRLEIPAIGRDDIVVAGVSLDDLKAGPGHYDDTPLPGQLGNAAVAGHRTTYGAPFLDVDQLRAGDQLITTLANGDRFVYEVTAVEIVEATDYWVVATRDPDIAELTLTSCHPKYTARQRIVVHSVLNPAKSSNVGVPTFYELEPDEAGDAPGDDPVLVADDIEITETESALAEPEAAAPATDASEDATADADAPGTVGTEGTTTEDAAAIDGDADDADDGDVDDVATAAPPTGAGGASATGPSSPSPDTPADAFHQGWFDDDGAWPQIALWGLVLTVVALLAYQLAKATRRSSLGLVAGVAPFLVALYFFYQNVNRLLPPGI